ncbi:MAG TPA: ABC transporter ATP-binding protein [Candidatus Deferrimicrobiaceae bacterium]|nr:ABC transporter ATP-binding protein [Candidatus Deferrimicrobiaceae bacterium]
MKETDFLIKVEELSKSYPTGFWRRRIRVLTDLSFTVARNEIVGFLGPNGAGKTTTIKILNRLAFPDSGTVTVFGEEAGRRPELRRRIGFMPEQPYFYEYLTGEEFLGLCGHLNGLSRAEIARGSQRMLSRVGLDGAGRTAIRKYSKGMMQRLGLAQALLHEPELVILDEPMSGLDPVGRMEVRNLILELKASGKTVFFSSHIISDVEALCDRVIILLKGRKVAEGRVEELVGREGIRYVELLFSPVPDEDSLSRLGVPPEEATVRGNAFVLRAKDYEEANRWIERFREAGSLVRSCIPVKKHLEDIYVEQVAGRERNGGPTSDPESPRKR